MSTSAGCAGSFVRTRYHWAAAQRVGPFILLLLVPRPEDDTSDMGCRYGGKARHPRWAER